MRFLWDRAAPGGATGRRPRRASPTLTRLEGRLALSHSSYLTAVPGLILSSTPYTGTPDFSQAHDGLAPVTFSGQFIAEAPAIKLRDYTTVRTRTGRVNVPAADDGNVVQVFPQEVNAVYHAVDVKQQFQPSGPIVLTRQPYSNPVDPNYSKDKNKFVYQFHFVVDLPYTSYRYDDQHLIPLPPSVGRQYSVYIDAQSRDSGYFTPVQLNLLHNTSSTSPTG